MVNFAKARDTLSVGVQVVGSAKGITGTLSAIEQGAINVGRAEGASNVTILAKDVANDRLASVLGKKGFSQIVKDGKQTNNWIKTFKKIPAGGPDIWFDVPE